MPDEKEYFTCECGKFDHTLRFILDLDENSIIPIPTIYAELGLNHYLPWYKRLIIGIKYVFGTQTGAAYDCWMIDGKGEDPTKMISMLQKLKERMSYIAK